MSDAEGRAILQEQRHPVGDPTAAKVGTLERWVAAGSGRALGARGAGSPPLHPPSVSVEDSDPLADGPGGEGRAARAKSGGAFRSGRPSCRWRRRPLLEVVVVSRVQTEKNRQALPCNRLSCPCRGGSCSAGPHSLCSSKFVVHPVQSVGTRSSHKSSSCAFLPHQPRRGPCKVAFATRW